VTIGDALAEARRQAGLTITQVSQRTCIRETIIRGIERGDFSACGGDFYARGHIRSIARAVGTEPEPLIREYDATQGAPDSITAADVFEPSTPIKLKERRRPNWSLAMLVALAAIVGVATYHFLSGPSKPNAGSVHQAAAAGQSGKHAGKTSEASKKGQVTTVRKHRHEVVIVIHAVSSDCWVQLTSTTGVAVVGTGPYYTGDGQYTIPLGETLKVTEHKAVELTIGDPAAVTLTVNGKTRTPGAAGQPLTIGPAHKTAG
jgi:cytoskeletal protein RodZ